MPDEFDTAVAAWREARARAAEIEPGNRAWPHAQKREAEALAEVIRCVTMIASNPANPAPTEAEARVSGAPRLTVRR